MTLIIGASSSGKSEFAENLITGSNKIYIATMMPFSKTAIERIKKHQKMRKNKGFSTIECYYDLEKLEIMQSSNVLLECLGNLVANEIFSRNTQNVVQKIMKGLIKLENESENLVIVSNDVFADGIEYDAETLKYMQILAEINAEIAKKSDKVIEIVCGIPIYIKGEYDA